MSAVISAAIVGVLTYVIGRMVGRSEGFDEGYLSALEDEHRDHYGEQIKAAREGRN
jgi:hypothetical protein